MKKALIVTNLSGFLWKFELDNVALLQSLGYEVHFASNGNEKCYEFEFKQLDEKAIIFHHIDIARSPYMWKMNLKALKQLKQIIIKENISIIHCHTPVGGVLARLATIWIKQPIKVVYTAHGFHFYKGAPLLNNIVFKAVEHGMARLTDVLIVINAEDYEQAQKLHLKKNGRVEKIPGVGVDRTKFVPVMDGEKEALRRKHNLPVDEFFILSVGELNLNKNYKTIIHAIKLIKDELQETNIIYGICGEGYWREEIINYARKLGVLDSVRFFGYQDNIREYYAMADITVFPSKREGLGMVGLESFSMGIPVVASDNRGTREYMRTGENGFVCRWNDVNEFKESVLRYMNLDEDEKQKMKKCCFDTVEKFDMKITHDKMKNIYKKLDWEIYGNGGKTTD